MATEDWVSGYMNLAIVRQNHLILVSISILCSVLFAMAATRGAKVLEKEYVSVLSRLFKPVKAGSRHFNSALPTDELFQLRKAKFDELYRSTHMAQSCKVVHVAGTKGKGSTVEFISSSLIASGQKVGIFTSPHMHTARERIRVGRTMISREDLTRCGEDALQFLSNSSWQVFFDLLLATGLRYFDEQKVNYMVLECGIGGRYDTTNFIENPAACVITSISLDHQQVLGETVEEIAWQKAGIIKPSTHVFTPASQLPSVLKVFQKQCESVQATLHVVPVDRSALAEHGSVCETDVQVENACLSQAVLNFLGVPPLGWDQFYWPCRVERFTHLGRTVVLDGCHNGDSVKRFLRGMRQKYPDKRLLVLFGAGHDKCLSDMMTNLLDQADEVIMVQSKHFRAISEKELLSSVPESRRHVIHAVQQDLLLPSGGSDHAVNLAQQPTLGDRLQWAVENSKLEDTVIAVCGSLFAAAEAREHLFRVDPTLFSETDWVRESDPYIPI